MASYMDKKGTAQHPLHNRALHISRAFKTQEKVNIAGPKANIGAGKANIEEIFKPKTAAHIRKLQEIFGLQTVFGRSDVQKALGLKPTRSSALLRDLEEQGVTEPVSGHGKGKYRFRAVSLWYNSTGIISKTKE